MNSVKGTSVLPIISNFSSLDDVMLDMEFKSTCVYSLVFNDKNSVIESEYKNKPIIK